MEAADYPKRQYLIKHLHVTLNNARKKFSESECFFPYIFKIRLTLTNGSALKSLLIEYGSAFRHVNFICRQNLATLSPIRSKTGELWNIRLSLLNELQLWVFFFVTQEVLRKNWLQWQRNHNLPQPDSLYYCCQFLDYDILILLLFDSEMTNLSTVLTQRVPKVNNVGYCFIWCDTKTTTNLLILFT
jgi:hypothetical protein